MTGIADFISAFESGQPLPLQNVGIGQLIEQTERDWSAAQQQIIEAQRTVRRDTLRDRRDEENRRFEAAEEAQVEGMAQTLGFDNRFGRFLASGLLKAGTSIEGVVARAKEGDFPGIPKVAQAISYVVDPAGLAGADFKQQVARDGGSVADAVSHANQGLTAGRQQADRNAGLSEREVWWMDQGEGITSSLATMAAAAPAGPGAIAALFGAESANEALTRVRDEHPEWSDNEQELYAASIGIAEGGLTWAFGRAGKGGLEAVMAGLFRKSGRQAAATTVKPLADRLKTALAVGLVETGHELTEELSIAAVQATIDRVSRMDPEAWSAENIEETIKSTVAQVIGGMGAAKAAQAGVGQVRKRFSREELLTPDGAREFAEQNPEAAERIVENPSRKVVQETTGIDPKEMNKQDRELMAEALRQTKAQAEQRVTEIDRELEGLPEETQFVFRTFWDGFLGGWLLAGEGCEVG